MPDDPTPRIHRPEYTPEAAAEGLPLWELAAGRESAPPYPDPAPGKSDTSKAAAEMIRDHVPTQRARILGAVCAAGRDGITRDELSTRLRIRLASVTGRVTPMVKNGELVELVETRPTESGAPAHVLVAPEHVNGRPRKGGTV